MEKELICLDTSVLIDLYRKTDKKNSFFYELTFAYNLFAISVITEYEVMVGSNELQDKFWRSFFQKVTVLPLTRDVNKVAIELFRQLKAVNKLIEIPDLIIAATAIANNLKLATLNNKHFERVSGLSVLTK